MKANVSPTVMIVDDELFFRTLLREILEKQGMIVVAEAVNGRDAVEKYRQHRPDVTIMDIVMPEMHGIDATREIIAADAHAMPRNIAPRHARVRYRHSDWYLQHRYFHEHSMDNDCSPER